MSPDRRTRIADAAIATLAAVGTRGLTHREVDRAADLAEGSTSYYFRTRQALLQVALERITELDTARTGTPPARLDDPDQLADLFAAAVERMLTTDRDITLARYELTLEAARRPELRALLIANGARFRDAASQLLTALGVTDARRRGPELVACLDGLVFDRLVGAGARAADRAELRAACQDLLRGFTHH